ncbi:MAG: DNA-3-methyladenine glycosylase family protein [Bacteroidota bacterium]|jgi:DNA-3-methyladenine glycosylase II|nr:DNA-3-methyladenine glycosylase 2 family protein [Saprospiraceae bacterium]
MLSSSKKHPTILFYSYFCREVKESIEHLTREPHIADIIRVVGEIEAKPSGGLYIDLLESIISQQLSVKASETIFRRFLLLFDNGYPDVSVLSLMTPEQLRLAGVSQQKAQYILSAARFAKEHNLEQKRWDDMPDEEIIQFLTQIDGVGRWTVEMLLIFSLRRQDVFPVDDLGIRRSMVRLFGLQESGRELKKRMIQLAEAWRPWRTTASLYLWRWKGQF